MENNKRGFTLNHHAEKSLLSIPTTTNNTQGRDPEQKLLRMALCKGFTLIELLVVVLIIGILAAIAVPQYQKAIAKSRAMKMVNLLRAHIPVWENFYLEHGTNPSSFDELGLQLPADWNERKVVYAVTGPANKEMAIAYYPALQAVQIGFISGPYKGAGFAYFFTGRVGGGGNYGTVPAKEIVCSEYPRSFKRTEGDFCEKIFRGNKTYGSGSDRYYRFPL